jgi:serine/threonine protein kinase
MRLEVNLSVILAEDEPNLKKNILAAKVINWPSTMSTKVRSLITACFDLDASKRIKIDEIETHPWMVKYKDLI